MNVTAYIGEWLSYVPTNEFAQMAESGETLVDRLRPHSGAVRTAKAFGIKIDISKQQLLDFIAEKYPGHGAVCYTYPDWFDQQVEELREFIEAV